MQAQVVTFKFFYLLIESDYRYNKTMVKPNGPGRTQLCVKHPQYKFLNKFTTSAES